MQYFNENWLVLPRANFCYQLFLQVANEIFGWQICNLLLLISNHDKSLKQDFRSFLFCCSSRSALRLWELECLRATPATFFCARKKILKIRLWPGSLGVTYVIPLLVTENYNRDNQQTYQHKRLSVSIPSSLFPYNNNLFITGVDSQPLIRNHVNL